MKSEGDKCYFIKNIICYFILKQKEMEEYF